MADTTAEVVHQHYANSTAAIAAMNDKNWAFEEAGDRIIVMDGATPRYFDTTENLLASNSFVLNQTASPQTGGLNLSGAGTFGGAVSVGGLFSTATNASINGILTVSASASVGSALVVGTTLTVTGLSSGRVPVTSTAGLITQDNLYWDATNDRLGIGSGASTPGSAIDVVYSSVGSNLIINLSNTDSTNAGSNARFRAITNGGSGGDPYMHFSISGVTEWSIGPDNSDSDAFVISESSVLGTNNRIRVSSTQLRAFGNLQVDGTTTLAATSATTLTTSGLHTAQGGTLYNVNSSSAQGKIHYATTEGLAIRGITGATYDLMIYSADAGALISNATGTRNLTVGHSSGSVTIGNTLNVTGLQTNSEALAFGAAGTSGAYRIFRSATNGLQLRGGTGSSYDLFLSDASGNAVLRVPTGTASLQLPNAAGVTVTGPATFSSTVSTGSLTVSGSSSHNITDNTTSAFSVYEGITGRSYFLVHTTNGSEEITIGNDTTDPMINFYTGNVINFYGQVQTNTTLSVLRALSFGTPNNIGTLSTSAGSPTSYSAVDKNCLVANVDPGGGNSSYFNLTGGLTTQTIYLRNATGRSLYLMNGGSQVNPLGVGYNATLIYDGSTWQVYGTGI